MPPSVPPLPDLVAQLRQAGCVHAEDEARLLADAASTPEQLTELVRSRVSGRPLEHVLGWAEFCGLRLAVQPGLFVPRPRTELLARQAAASANPGDVVVDLCCGSGAVAAVVAATVPGVVLHAADIDPEAVRCARRNLAAAGGQVHLGDLFAPLPPDLRGHIDVLVANAPYVPTGELGLLPSEARDHEPRLALDGGADGLDILRRVVAEAAGWLAPDGRLLVETSEQQATRLIDLTASAGLVPRVVRSDELEAVVVIGTKRRL